MILPYCVLLAESAAALPARGISEAQVQTITIGAVCAAFSEFDAPKRRRPEAVEFAQVIAQVFAGALVLPFRFGTSFDGREELQQHLAANALAYSNFLSEHRTHVQMELRLPVEGAARAHAMPASGREFLRQKMRTRQSDKDAFLRILEVSGPGVIHALEAESPGFEVTGRRAVVLVDRSSIADLKERWHSAFDRVGQVQVIGPVPPTDFFQDMVKRSRQ